MYIKFYKQSLKEKRKMKMNTKLNLERLSDLPKNTLKG